MVALEARLFVSDHGGETQDRHDFPEMINRQTPPTSVSSQRGVTRLQLRLRTLMLVVGACSVILGAYVRRAREQQSAVAALRVCGAEVFYEYQEQPRGSLHYDGSSQADVPQWLLSSLGADFFFNVTGVNLALGQLPMERDGKIASADDLAEHLAFLPNLRGLNLHESSSDTVFPFLSRLTGLESLHICGTAKVTDAGIAHLVYLSRLKELYLPDYRITDESLHVLGRIDSLRELDLSYKIDLHKDYCLAVTQVTVAGNNSTETVGEGSIGSGVTVKGLAHLRRLQNLQCLDLSNNRIVSDKWMPSIGQLHSLQRLVLQKTHVTSNGLACLTGLRELKNLDLSCNAGVDDRGLHHVVQLASLEDLDLSFTAITSRSVGMLKQLKGLKRLVLSANASVTDEAARALGDMANLQELDLAATSITPSAVEHLTRLTSLRYLAISLPNGSRFSLKAAVSDSLKRALPRCEVHVF